MHIDAAASGAISTLRVDRDPRFVRGREPHHILRDRTQVPRAVVAGAEAVGGDTLRRGAGWEVSAHGELPGVGTGVFADQPNIRRQRVTGGLVRVRAPGRVY